MKKNSPFSENNLCKEVLFEELHDYEKQVYEYLDDAFDEEIVKDYYAERDFFVNEISKDLIIESFYWAPSDSTVKKWSKINKYLKLKLEYEKKN